MGEYYWSEKCFIIIEFLSLFDYTLIVAEQRVKIYNLNSSLLHMFMIKDWEIVWPLLGFCPGFCWCRYSYKFIQTITFIYELSLLAYLSIRLLDYRFQLGHKSKFTDCMSELRFLQFSILMRMWKYWFTSRILHRDLYLDPYYVTRYVLAVGNNQGCSSWLMVTI